MTVDVVNSQNQKVGSLDVRDDVFGGRVKTDLIWESVVRENAAERRGTHATKNRGAGQRQRQEAVAAEGHRPRARRRGAEPAVAQGRHGVRPAAAQLRLPRCRRRSSGARCARRSPRSSRTARVTVVDALAASRDQDEGGGGDAEGARRDGQDAARRREARREAARCRCAISTGVRFVPSNRVTARDVMDTRPRDRDARGASSGCRRCWREADRRHPPPARSPRRRRSSARTGGRSCSRWRRDANKIEIRQRRREAARLEGRERAHGASRTARSSGRAGSSAGARTGRRRTCGCARARSCRSSSKEPREQSECEMRMQSERQIADLALRNPHRITGFRYADSHIQADVAGPAVSDRPGVRRDHRRASRTGR